MSRKYILFIDGTDLVRLLGMSSILYTYEAGNVHNN